jgi:hypothetical protein
MSIHGLSITITLLFGISGVLLTGFDTFLQWRDDIRRNKEKRSSRKLFFIVVGVLMSLGALVAGAVEQGKSEGKAEASLKAMLQNTTLYTQMSEQDKARIKELESKLSENVTAMHPERARIEVTMTDGKNRFGLHELTSATDGKKAGVILMVRNVASENAVDGNLLIRFCEGCHPIVNYPSNDMLTIPFSLISGGGHDVLTDIVHFTIPPGKTEIPITVNYECKTCEGNPPTQRLKLHLVYSPNVHFSDEPSSK